MSSTATSRSAISSTALSLTNCLKWRIDNSHEPPCTSSARKAPIRPMSTRWQRR